MIDFSKPLQTRAGAEVKIYSCAGGGTYPIHGAYKAHDADFWTIACWRESGSFYSDLPGDKDNPLNLVNAKSKKTGTLYINLYWDPINKQIVAGAYPTRKEADAAAYTVPARLDCIEVPFEVEIDS